MGGGSISNRKYANFASAAMVTCWSYPQTGPNEQSLRVITKPYKPIQQCPS